jgi:hypothetical protein
VWPTKSARDLDRQPRLAGARDPCQCHHTHVGVADQRDHRTTFGRASEERCRDERELRGDGQAGACRRDPWLEQDTPIVIDDTCQFDERRLARRREQFIDLAVAEAHRVGDSHEILPSARSRHPAGEPVDDGRLGHTGQTADQTWRVAGGATHVGSQHVAERHPDILPNS